MTRRSLQSSKTLVWFHCAVSPPRVHACLFAHLATSENLVARVALAVRHENIGHPGHPLHLIPLKGSSDRQERRLTPESSKSRLIGKAMTCFRWTSSGMFKYERGIRHKGVYIGRMPAMSALKTPRQPHLLWCISQKWAALSTRMN
jgi:hypothetical protein